MVNPASDGLRLVFHVCSLVWDQDAHQQLKISLDDDSDGLFALQSSAKCNWVCQRVSKIDRSSIVVSGDHACGVIFGNRFL